MQAGRCSDVRKCFKCGHVGSQAAVDVSRFSSAQSLKVRRQIRVEEDRSRSYQLRGRREMLEIDAIVLGNQKHEQGTNLQLRASQGLPVLCFVWGLCWAR